MAKTDESRKSAPRKWQSCHRRHRERQRQRSGCVYVWESKGSMFVLDVGLQKVREREGGGRRARACGTAAEKGLSPGGAAQWAGHPSCTVRGPGAIPGQGTGLAAGSPRLVHV